MGLLKRGSGAGGKGGKPMAAEDPQFAEECPALAEFLTSLAWDDGQQRKTGTLLLVTEDGMWRAWLHDRDGKRSGWVSGLTYYDLMDAVERGLRDDAIAWRHDKK